MIPIPPHAIVHRRPKRSPIQMLDKAPTIHPIWSEMSQTQAIPPTHSDHETLHRVELSSRLGKRLDKAVKREKTAQNTLVIAKHGKLRSATLTATTHP